jgi:NarL family two-component system response regulator LiaR
MTETIHILIVDDHAVVRKGIQALIATEPGMVIVGEASNGKEAVELARVLLPDVILMDVVMPVKDGIQAIGEIVQENPQIRILALTSFAEDDKVLPAIKAGALGYLLKDASPQQLLHGIRDVYRRVPTLDSAVAFKLIQELNRPGDPPSMAEEPLSEREIEVLQLVARGLTNQEIAEQLCITERTVRNHVGNILSKLHLNNRTQAALYALRQGLASLDAM